MKSIVNGFEFFSNFDWGVFLLITVKTSIGGQNEEKTTVVSGEIFMAEVIGEIIAKVAPNSHIDLLLHIDEKIGKKLIFPFSVADIVVIVFIVIGHRCIVGVTINFFIARVIKMKEYIIDLENN